MPRRLTPSSSLDSLRTEAKRWLKRLRAGDARAHERLDAVLSAVPEAPTLRDVQLALAREHGFDGWLDLKRAVEAIATQAPGARDQAVQDLLLAASRGETDRVNALLDGWPAIVSERALLPGHTGLRTALHHALSHPDTVAALLARGADPNVRDEGDDAIPLHFAAERGDLPVIRMLIEHGSDPIGEGTVHGLSVIGWATVFGGADPAVVEYLLAHGARHTLPSAVATGAVDAIRTLAGEAPERLDLPLDRANQHRRPLHLAIVKEQAGSLQALLELGADVEATDAAGLTPLDQAGLAGEREMAELLLAHGATVRLPAAVGLHREQDIDRLLTEDPGAVRPGGRWASLIVRAAERSPGRVIRRLLDAGASAQAVDAVSTSVDGVANYTALHAAAFHGNAEAAEVLLEAGADPTVRDGRYCATPAGWAVHAGHAAVRDRILAARIDPFDAIDFDRADRIPDIVRQSPWLIERRFHEYADCNGMEGRPEPWHAPLHWAIVRNRTNAVRALLEAGAIQRPTPEGRWPLQLAEALGFDDAAEELRRFASIEASPAARGVWFIRNACPDHGVRGPSAHVIARNTAMRLAERFPDVAGGGLHADVVLGDVEAVERTLTADPDAANRPCGPKGWTPLLYLCFTRLPDVPAAVENALPIARLLLDHGADPNAFFMAGDSVYTPLTGAIGEGEEERPAHPARDGLVDLLLEHDAEPYDSQVLYNIHFHGDELWFLKRVYEHAVRRGRAGDWADPEWRMLDMGGYGCGARWHLETAIRQNDLALAEWCLAHGASPNAPPATDPRFPKSTLFEEAMRRGQREMATLLGRYGAEVRSEPVDPEVAFTLACMEGRFDDARSLAVTHPGLRTAGGTMHAAIDADRADVVAFLLDLGMPLEVENEHRQRPLHLAAWKDAVDVGALLIERGAEIDPVEAQWNNTPLDFAVYCQNPRMIELLVPHSRDLWNLTFAGAIDRLRAILADEPGLATRTASDGATPLMWLPDDESAAHAIVDLFLAHGADAAARDGAGRTAADLALRRGMAGVAERLRVALRTAP